ACHLCDRPIKRIFQPFSPVAEIRKAAADPAKANEYDEFIYLLTVFSLYSDFQIRLFITRTLLYTMMPDWRKSLPVLSKAFAATLFTAPCCFSALRIIGYILLILLQKIKNSIKLRIRK
ncbi:MAG: hypothetical protein IKA87_02720, partial [Lentisphaeria bacterium]|nr:hypothetical protein [Lentisphaeria bacterium]